ncbi:MAG: lysophospholipase L1-like esterase [Candidatus Promineifilaceae bacterium]|jgi:lysophospholipase L1-like esterase
MINKRNIVILLLLGMSAASFAGAPNRVVKDGDTVAFLGDSITAGGASYSGYCRLVIQGLKTVGVSAAPICAGVSGNTSADMLLRLDADVLDHKPDHVFLSAGVNDIWHHDPTVKIGVFQAGPGRGVALEHYKIYVRQIVERCQAAGANVILSTITPITEDPAFKLNRRSEMYNAFLRELAEEKSLPLAELNEAMFAKIAELKAVPEEISAKRRHNVLTSDGVHPLSEGHQVMAQGILKAMGLSDKELEQAKKEWDTSPILLILGDRQVNAGGRAGGWCHMVLDGMNMGGDLVTHKSVKTAKVAQALASLDSHTAEGRVHHILLVAPKGDVDDQTPLDTYRASVSSIVDATRERGQKPIVATIPWRDPDANNEANAGINAYNTVLRELCKEKKVPLADIAHAMQVFWEENPQTALTLGEGERVNHQGGMLMAEVVLRALGGDDTGLPRLHELWDARSSYTFKHAYRATFGIDLSHDGHTALDEIRERFHMVDSGKIIKLGLHELLTGDDTTNNQRIEFFHMAWVSPTSDTNREPYQVTTVFTPSANEGRALHAYMAKEEIAPSELYARAFKVGATILRKEDPLGRGAY